MKTVVRKLSAILSAILVVSMFFQPISAYAYAGNTSTNTNLSVSTSWQDIAWSTSSSQGINCDIEIVNSTNATSGNGLGWLASDIRMLDNNGNVVWEESQSCPGRGSRVYWCGNDVYHVQIKQQWGTGLARAYIY